MPEGGAGGGALREFNALPEAEAAQRLRGCCAALRWAQEVAAGRPYADVRALLDASHVAFSHLTDADLRQALAGQPRVGARLADADPGASWPPRERSGAQAADAATRHALLASDAAYEQRFGQVFVVNASGLTGGELLHRLQVRMRNDRETERRIVREELRGITRRRLEEQFAP